MSDIPKIPTFPRQENITIPDTFKANGFSEESVPNGLLRKTLPTSANIIKRANKALGYLDMEVRCRDDAYFEFWGTDIEGLISVLSQDKLLALADAFSLLASESSAKERALSENKPSRLMNLPNNKDEYQEFLRWAEKTGATDLEAAYAVYRALNKNNEVRN